LKTKLPKAVVDRSGSGGRILEVVWIMSMFNSLIFAIFMEKYKDKVK